MPSTLTNLPKNTTTISQSSKNGVTFGNQNKNISIPWLATKTIIYYVEVSDSLSVSDNINIFRTPIILSVSDSVSVTDSFSGSVVIPPRTISVSDTTTMTDSATVTKGSSISGTFGTNLISHWKLEETSGTRADSTANANTLQDNNTVTYGAGVATGNAALFTPINSEYLSIADASQTGLDITGDFTISAWFKMNSALTSWFPVIVKDQGETGNKRSYGVGLREVSGDCAEFWMSSTGENATVAQARVSLGTTLSTGTWYHGVWQYTASTHTIEFYLNASSKGTSDITNTSIYNSTADVQIGGYVNGGVYADGYIDEMTAWSRVLSSSEITTLYNSGTPLPY